MSEQLLLVVVIASMVLAFVLGIWIGLGYPGLYERHEDTGARVPRKAPYRMVLDRMGDWMRAAVDRAVGVFFGD